MDVTQFYTPQKAPEGTNSPAGRTGLAQGQQGDNAVQGEGADLFQALFYSFMNTGDTDTLSGNVIEGETLSEDDMNLLKTVLESNLPGSDIPTSDALALLGENLSEEGLEHLQMLEGMSLLQTPASPDTDAAKIDISTIFNLDGEGLTDDQGLLERLAKQLENLQESGEAATLLPNLTPEQMTNLQNKLVEAAQSGEFPEDLEGLESVVAALVPLQNNQTKPEVISDTAEDLALAQILGQKVIGDKTLSPDNKNNALNDKNAAQVPTPQTADATQLTQPADDGLLDDLMNIQNSTDKFKALMKNAAIKAQGQQVSADGVPSQPQASTAELKAAAEAATQGQNAGAPPAPLPSGALSGFPYSEGSMITSMGLTSDALQGAGFAQGGAYQASGTSSPLTNISMQAPHATQGHPGTNMVAATLTRGITNGQQNQIMTLHLDPAELGRVEVRMEFGKDRNLKATVISEKPETHLMLQRDSQSLERALQESGLDADGSSLEFSMADDGHNFNQDGRHDGSRNQASFGGGEAGDEDSGLIETTMTWHVDPDTGYTHYNILV